MKTLIINLSLSNDLALKIAKELNLSLAELTLREFPDGESYIRIHDDLKDKSIIIIDSLDRPNSKLLPLILVAETARDLGCKAIGLVAPYLAYMRQDMRFQAGEGITSNYFASLISHYFDWLITVDPHLHRHHHLSELYSIPSVVVSAAKKLSQWIVQHVEKPILIGPDSESEQWVSEVAENAKSPYLILQKKRLGDQEVEISAPDLNNYKDHSPILIDDIISTAATMLKTITYLKKISAKKAICMAVHAVFANEAYEHLLKNGVKEVITCNTISHPTNRIDISPEISSAIQALYKRITS